MLKRLWMALAVLALAGLPRSAHAAPDMPQFVGIEHWFNTDRPVTTASLDEHVVLVDFWTYSCVNCIRTLPYLKAWYRQYHDYGLEIVGVHSPEFAFEKDEGNVEAAITRLGITYPVAMDNDHAMWKAYYNRYWPAEYLVDRSGHVRKQHFGEGNYQATEREIRALLVEGRPDLVLPPVAPITTQAPQPMTPEIYLGFARLSNLGNDMTVEPDTDLDFLAPSALAPNRFYLDGQWRFTIEQASLVSGQGKIELRFQANQANMVLDTDRGQEIPIEVLIDGQPATLANKGASVVLENGASVCHVHGARLYTLAQFPPTPTGPAQHTLELRIMGAGLRAYTFTFG